MPLATPDITVTPNYNEVVAIDVAASLQSGETLTSIVSTTLKVLEGTDADAALRLLSASSIVNTTQCAVRIGDMVDGCVYELVFLVTSTLSGETNQWDTAVRIICASL
jgi:hypothetical protein